MSRKQGITMSAADRPKAAAQYLEKQRARLVAAGAEPAQWFRLTVNHNVDTAELFIYDEIGYWGVTASDLLNELAGVTASTINVRINSPGGDVFDGIAIYNALLSHPATVNTTVDSLAASAASFIAMAGDSVTMMPHSQLMIHDAAMMMFGAFNPADLREIADLLDRQSDNIAAIYADAAGGSVESWRTAMQAETWYTAQQAVDSGLATAVAPKPQRSSTEPDDGQTDPAAPLEDALPTFDPRTFREALRVAATLRPRPFDAQQLRRAFEEASK